MSLSGVVINKGQLGANRLGSEDAVSAIVVLGPPPAGIAVLEALEFFSINDAIEKGIDASFDQDNNVVVYRHIREFYRIAGESTKLFCTFTTSTLDVAIEESKELLNKAKGEIKQIGFVFANQVGLDISVDGMPEDVRNNIAALQGLHNWSFEKFMPVQTVLECPKISLPASSVLDLRAIENLEATKVSLVIGQDYDYAKELNEDCRNYAEAGTALGLLARAKVFENIGDNEQFNITDATRGAWLEPGLSNHQPNTEVANHLNTLDAKGYLFGVNYAGLAGVRFNNDHVCAPIILDAENNINEHTIAYGRVADKAVRELRRAYLPKVKTTWNVDSTTGKLSSGTIVALEDIGDQVFADMLERGEISFGKANIDPNSDLLVEKILRVSYVIVPKGTINKIEGTLNLKTRE